MTAKIFKSIFVSAIVVFVITIAVTLGISYNYYSGEVEKELRREAEFVKEGFENYGDEYLRTLDGTNLRISRILPDGRVVFDTRVEDSALSDVENHLEREEISEALKEGEGYAVRYSDTASERTVYCALRLEDGSVLRVASVHKSIVTLLPQFLTPILLLFLGMTALAFFVANRLSVSIVRPINEIDLNSPERAVVYEELKPMINKLSTQNRKISRQLSELKLRENEFSSITANMSEGMIVINSRIAVLSCNESARRILDTKEELPRSVLSLKNGDRLRAPISAALSGKTGYEEMSIGEKHYGIIATPVFHDGIVEGAVIMLIDDTEKEKREALRREFTSNVSHELKTPLTSISGFAELIRCGMAEGEEAKHFAENIMREADRLITLVGDIIRLTQLDGGEIPYDKEKIDLYEVAEDVISRLANVAEGAGIELSVDGASAMIRGTRHILEEMIYNLCDNGIKYNSSGGYVRVNVGCDESTATVSVTDNGIGIPADMQDRVFERFYRVDKSHSKKIGGTGLGLSIVKHAAAYHKAKLSLESEIGLGTTVTVRFDIENS